MPKRRPFILRMWKLLETGNIYPINSQFYDVNSLIKVLKYLGFADEEQLSFEKYFENVQTSLQNDKVHNQILKCTLYFLFFSQQLHHFLVILF